MFRFESGDPNFAPPTHVLDAVDAAARTRKTRYIPNDRDSRELSPGALASF